MDLPYTLDEATSSNDIMFMERASSGVIAHQHRRRRLPLRLRRALVQRQRSGPAPMSTGPTTGAIHSASSINPNGTTEQFGAVARVAGAGRQRQGLLAASRRRRRMADPAAAQSGHRRADADAERSPGTAHRSDHADLDRRDRQRIRRTGLQRRSRGHVSGRCILQGEYFWFNVERQDDLPALAASLKFQGGYAQAGYILTGETRKYNPAQRLLWRRHAGPSVLARWRRLGRMGNRRPRQHHGSQRSARHRHRRRRRTAERLHRWR